LENLEDVESSALGLRPGKDRVLEDRKESIVYSELALLPSRVRNSVFLQTWQDVKVFFFWGSGWGVPGPCPAGMPGGRC